MYLLVLIFLGTSCQKDQLLDTNGLQNNLQKSENTKFGKHPFFSTEYYAINSDLCVKLDDKLDPVAEDIMKYFAEKKDSELSNYVHLFGTPIWHIILKGNSNVEGKSDSYLIPLIDDTGLKSIMVNFQNSKNDNLAIFYRAEDIEILLNNSENLKEDEIEIIKGWRTLVEMCNCVLFCKESHNPFVDNELGIDFRNEMIAIVWDMPNNPWQDCKPGTHTFITTHPAPCYGGGGGINEPVGGHPIASLWGTNGAQSNGIGGGSTAPTPSPNGNMNPINIDLFLVRLEQLIFQYNLSPFTDEELFEIVSYNSCMEESNDPSGEGSSTILNAQCALNAIDNYLEDAIAFNSNLNSSQIDWLLSEFNTIQGQHFLLTNPNIVNFLMENQEDLEETEGNESELSLLAVQLVLDELENNEFHGPYGSSYEDLLAQYAEEVPDPVIFHVLYTVECATLKLENPGWQSTWGESGLAARAIFNILLERLHLVLDGFGLVPAVGEVADLTNGFIYLLEGDGVNATFSFSATIPIVGWLSSGTKYAQKAITGVSGRTIKLKLIVDPSGIVTFGNRGQLKTVIKPPSGHQAHHIIPWAEGSHDLVQQAAKGQNAFHLNGHSNGVGLPSNANNNTSNLPIHSGSHDNYTNQIRTEMDNRWDANMTPVEAKEELEDIIQHVRTVFANNSGVGINTIDLGF